MLSVMLVLYNYSPMAVDNFRTVVVEIHPLPFAQSKRLLHMMLNTHKHTYGMADNPAFCCGKWNVLTTVKAEI